MGRVDYNLTRQRLYGRYFYSKYTRDPVSGAQDLVRARRRHGVLQPERLVRRHLQLHAQPAEQLRFSYNRNNGTIDQRRAVHLSRVSG